MAINNGKNGVNEELPDEYEVIQHSVRDNPDKQQQDKQQQDKQQKDKQQRGSQKQESSCVDKSTSRQNGTVSKK